MAWRLLDSVPTLVLAYWHNITGSSNVSELSLVHILLTDSQICDRNYKWNQTVMYVCDSEQPLSQSYTTFFCDSRWQLNLSHFSSGELVLLVIILDVKCVYVCTCVYNIISPFRSFSCYRSRKANDWDSRCWRGKQGRRHGDSEVLGLWLSHPSVYLEALRKRGKNVNTQLRQEETHIQHTITVNEQRKITIN